MIETLKATERIVCVGQTALRSPSGDFLPSVPLYIKVDEGDVIPKTNISRGESGLIDNIAEVLMPKFKQYVAGVKALKRDAHYSSQAGNRKEGNNYGTLNTNKSRWL